MKEIISTILITTAILISFVLVLKVASDKQVVKDCLKAERHFLEYNVPIPEDLNSLCVELNIYN